MFKVFKTKMAEEDHEDNRQAHDEEQPLLHYSRSAAKHVKSTWDGFINFALRDNVLEVAIGLIIASAFTTVVNSLVTDIILPPISLLFGYNNLEQKFAVLRHGHNSSAHYNTYQQAHDDGAITLNYGNFLEHMIQFFLLGATMYSLGQFYGAFTADAVIKYQVKCIACRKDISQKAKRCAYCSTWQDGREM